MCLTIDENAKRKTAKKDIVVYKRIIPQEFNTIEDIKDGDIFNGTINGVTCNGRIHKTQNGVLYFCTNEVELNGLDSPEKYSYKNSWVLDIDVTSIIVNGVEMINKIIKLYCYITPYQNFRVLIGETYKSKLIELNDMGIINVAIHSFANLRDAINDGGGVCAKCIIPRGSKYYEGRFCGLKAYASDTLTYVELVYP